MVKEEDGGYKMKRVQWNLCDKLTDLIRKYTVYIFY